MIVGKQVRDMANQRNGRLDLFDPKLQITPESGEERIAAFLSEYGRAFLLGLSILIGMTLVIIAWTMYSKGQSENDYFRAEEAFQKLTQIRSVQDNITNNTDYQELEAILVRHPELHQRYDGPLAQTFLRLGEVPLAISYADKALKQLSSEDLPFFEEYSKIALLIAQGNDREAFKRATFLQKRLNEENVSSRRVLGLFNEIRLAALMQRLAVKPEELKLWREVQQQPTAQQLLGDLRTGDVSFLDYVRAREQTLESNNG